MADGCSTLDGLRTLLSRSLDVGSAVGYYSVMAIIAQRKEPSMSEKAVARLRTVRPPLALFADRIEEKRPWPWKPHEHPVRGASASVDGAGIQMRGITFGNTAYLSIVGPGVSITRQLNGRMAIKQGFDFAAHVNSVGQYGVAVRDREDVAIGFGQALGTTQ